MDKLHQNQKDTHNVSTHMTQQNRLTGTPKPTNKRQKKKAQETKKKIQITREKIRPIHYQKILHYPQTPTHSM
jgi:hypothetical protein